MRDVGDGLGELVGQMGRELHDLAEQVRGVAHQSLTLEVAGGRHDLRHLFDPCLDEGVGLDHLDEANTRKTLHGQAHRPIGLLDHLVNGCIGADPVQVVLRGSIHGRVKLTEGADGVARADGVLDQAQRGLAPGGQRHDRVREHDEVAEGQDRNDLRHGHVRRPAVCLHLVGHGLRPFRPLRRHPRASAGSRRPGPGLRSGRGRPDRGSRPSRSARTASGPRSGSAYRASAVSSLG